jgi:hypothetical protein
MPVAARIFRYQWECGTILPFGGSGVKGVPLRLRV